MKVNDTLHNYHAMLILSVSARFIHDVVTDGVTDPSLPESLGGD